jgi:hypothetical protein
MFIKHGDGKINAIIDVEEINDELKKTAKETMTKIKQSVKQSSSIDSNKKLEE